MSAEEVRGRSDVICYCVCICGPDAAQCSIEDGLLESTHSLKFQEAALTDFTTGLFAIATVSKLNGPAGVSPEPF